MSHKFDKRFLLAHDILPFIREYSGSTFVIKYGGSVMKDNFLQSSVIKDICFLHSLGIKIILVHGGGPFINDWLNKLNISPQFRDGIRVTDRKTMEIVEMVLVGQVNKNLVSLFNQNNVLSIGLSGKDSKLIISSPLFSSPDNLVGKIDSINNSILKILLDNNYIPVIASVASDYEGNTHNINADTVAGSIAQSLSAEKLILLTDTLGVMSDLDDSSSLFKSLNVDLLKALKNQKVISGGMIPKVQCCLDAIKSNVNSAHIISGNIPNALLYETLTNHRVGSMITL
uniref:Acetylglutamate kinase n=1 Tax=Nitophyllum punctatum TaxID=158729 RepID=A0A4D6WW09_9FLOR|nr:acetylglutamate kinase [Nitophyllum punctatum]